MKKLFLFFTLAIAFATANVHASMVGALDASNPIQTSDLHRVFFKVEMLLQRRPHLLKDLLMIDNLADDPYLSKQVQNFERLELSQKIEIAKRVIEKRARDNPATLAQVEALVDKLLQF